MKATIAKSIANGKINAPASKSYAHRLLICAALSGTGVVRNIELSNDIVATLGALSSLGFLYEIGDKTVKFARKTDTNLKMKCMESGSTLRFIIPIAMAFNNRSIFSGTEKLFSRGLSVYEDIFKKQNISYQLEKDYLVVNGKLSAGKYEIDASISSQFISGLLFALPLLDGDSEIILKGEVESKPYIDITLDCLEKSEIEVVETASGYKIKGNQKYKLKEAEVEADYSNAAFLDGLNLLGGNVEISNLNPDSKQGDKVYKEIYQELVCGHPVIDLGNAIDLGPVLFTLASYFNGAKFINVRRLRIKESDRVSDVLNVLKEFGEKYDAKENEVEIYKNELHAPNKELDLPNDHRIVMAVSILLTKFGGVIKGAEAVNKSYPCFFKDLKSLGVDVKYE